MEAGLAIICMLPRHFHPDLVHPIMSGKDRAGPTDCSFDIGIESMGLEDDLCGLVCLGRVPLLIEDNILAGF